MHINRKIVAVVLLLCLVFAVAGCNQMDEREVAVRELLTKFQQACNVTDQEAIMECLSPSITDTVDVASDILGIFTDVDTKDLFDLLTSIVSSDFVGGDDFFTTMQIEVKSLDYSEENEAKVFTSVAYKSGEEMSRNTVVFTCEFSDAKWYISSFEFV